MLNRYTVVEVFATLQGEGRWTGRRAVFVRLAGCNMWSGRPQDRHKGRGACAQWCDTRFTGGESNTPGEILSRVVDAWGTTARPQGPVLADDRPMVVISGGEPTLQLDLALVRTLRSAGWYVSVETNGTRTCDALSEVDHVCVSPKRGSRLLHMWGGELKVVLPGCVPGAPAEHSWTDEEVLEIARVGQWGALYVQPQDVTDPLSVEVTALTGRRTGTAWWANAQTLFGANVRTCLEFIGRNPTWRLSLQTHKYIGLH